MSPQDRQEFERMKKELAAIKSVMDIPFIEEAKRRVVVPEFSRLGLTEIVSKTGTGNTSGVLQAVNEGGSGTYDVPAEYDGTITVRDVDGTSYKLGYYTP